MKRKRWPVLAFTFIVGLLILLALDTYYRQQIQQYNTQQLVKEAETARQRLQEAISLRILVVEDLRAFMLAQPALPDSPQFDRYAADVLAHFPRARALQYADTDAIIRYIYPLAGNEAALNLDLMTRPAAPLVQKTIQTGQTTVSDPITLVQGTLATVVRVPLYQDDRYVGLAQGVYDIDELLEDVTGELDPRLALTLQDTQGRVFWRAGLLAIDAVETAVPVAEGEWTLSLGWLPPQPGPEPFTIGLIWGLGGALLLTTLLALSQAFQRFDQMAAAVTEKTADLAQSEARYRTLVEAIDDGILLTDLAGNRLFCNPVYHTSLGFTAAELDQIDLMDRIHPDDAPAFQDMWQALLSTGAQDAEYRIRHKDGHWVYRYARTKLVRDAQGTPQAVIAITRDITEQKQADAALHFQAHLLNTVQQAVIATDLAGKITYWNRFAETLYGWKAEEVIGRLVHEVTPADPQDADIPDIMAELHEGLSWSGEFLVQTKDGTAFPAHVTDTPIYNDKGELIGIVGVSFDMTEQKQALAELEKRERRFRALIEHAPAGIALLNADGTLRYISPSTKRILGYESEDAVGLDPVALTHPDDRPQLLQLLAELIQTPGDVRTAQYRFQHKDGSWRWLEVTINNVLAEPSVKGIVFNFHDITERVNLEAERLNLEKQFYQAQKMEAVGQLSAGIAHDFNNMLMAININTELMQEQLDRDNPLYKRTDTILRTVRKAANLIRQMLIFSRRQMTDPHIVSLNEIITETNKMAARLIGEAVDVTLRLAPDLWPVKVDPGQAEQVIVNLMINARDAMPAGGQLILETNNIILDGHYTASHVEAQPGEYVQLTVSDTGTGMSTAVQDRLFEPFFTTKEVGKGTGLGLAMVYGFVKQSGGHLSVYSEEGRGTTFKIYLPRSTEPLTPAAADTATKPLVRGHETILVVEDDDAIRTMTAEVLEKQGYEVLTAENGREALQLAAQHSHHIDMLLTDVVMPKIGGVALADALTKQYPQLKVIYMSGYTNEALAHQELLASDSLVLQKPFSFVQLLHTVQDALA